ncbi:outer membrane usher protein [Winslowiella iniecta]|nr:outer membrane usher protein [Winslowiella iniecta]
MSDKNNGRFNALSYLTKAILISCLLDSLPASANEIRFNTDVMDIKDRENIDFAQFSRRGFILPGSYQMSIMINRHELPEQEIHFYPVDNNPEGSQACLTRNEVTAFAIKPNLLARLTWWHHGECLDISSIAGMEVRGELGEGVLVVKIPQNWLEYDASDWDPPSRWDDGIAGVLLDYNLNMQATEQHHTGTQSYSISGNGVTGANFEAWRLRAEWQGRFGEKTQSGENRQYDIDWSRYYGWRAIPSLRARLTLGEDNLDSAIFDSFRFTGLSLNSDDSMLPPGLRGYAAEVTGVARSNARVIISQQDRVLYETQVPAGPFRIQDLSDAVAGKLDVRIEEQDGNIQRFQIDTATVPYLTRPGMVRYKLAAGKPSLTAHRLTDPLFASTEFSWGISNSWSAYGGSILGEEYQAVSAGIGRDLFILGAVSVDGTVSRADVSDDISLSGESLRLSYAKRFESISSQLTFAGYRFSERNFMTMSDYLLAKQDNSLSRHGKQLYTLTFRQQFTRWQLDAYLNYSHQSYWDRPHSERYDLTLARMFDLAGWKNINVSLAGFRNKFSDRDDKGGWIAFALPWGTQSTLSYNLSLNNQQLEQSVGYFRNIDEQHNYQLSAGTTPQGGAFSGFYNHAGESAQLSASAGYQQGQYSSIGLSAQGGATLTPEGGAVHRVSASGGTRLLVDVDGLADVPVRGYGSPVKSNVFGKAVITDMHSYYPSRARIDVERLSDDIEATRSVVQATLTEGAIGYRKFNVTAGKKAMVSIHLDKEQVPPFGALLRNEKMQQTGMVSDEGSAWLSGIRPGERMSVEWDNSVQCYVQIPVSLSEPQLAALSLPCRNRSVGAE